MDPQKVAPIATPTMPVVKLLDMAFEFYLLIDVAGGTPSLLGLSAQIINPQIILVCALLFESHFVLFNHDFVMTRS